MNDLQHNAFMQLEETLLILEESISSEALSNITYTLHITRLKQFYSPQFDFEHSETGSYFHSALICVYTKFIDDPEYSLPLSDIFRQSLSYVIEISTLSLNISVNKSRLTECLISLAEIWDLGTTLDISVLLSQALHKMRQNLLQLNSYLSIL